MRDAAKILISAHALRLFSSFLESKGVTFAREVTPNLIRLYLEEARERGVSPNTVARAYGGLRCLFGFLSRWRRSHLPRADQPRRSWQDVLRLTPNKLGPIHLIEPCYADSGTHGAQVVRKLPVVSDVQLYLDCYRYPVRGREQAEHILSRVLMPRWRNVR